MLARLLGRGSVLANMTSKVSPLAGAHVTAAVHSSHCAFLLLARGRWPAAPYTPTPTSKGSLDHDFGALFFGYQRLDGH